MRPRQLWLCALWSVVLGACLGGSPDRDAVGNATTETAKVDDAALTLPSIGDCDALEDAAADEAHDAVLLPTLCPDHPLTKVERRTMLLAVASPRAAAALVPMLGAEPDLQGLARLVAHEGSTRDLPAELPSPRQAPVSPVTSEVLDNVQLANALLFRAGASADDRTRAEAYLAKVHIQALQQLGYARGQALPPFARLLAGRALHHGRRFCTAYWQRRVLGLETLFAETEVWLLDLVLALERTQHAADGALLAVERQRGRRYVQRPGPRARIERLVRKRPATAGAPLDALLPLANELERLLDHGFVDLAISRGLHVAAAPSSHGIGIMADMLAERLAAKDLEQYAGLLAKRRSELSSRDPPPASKGPRALEPLVPPPWSTRTQEADTVQHFIAAFDNRDGLARRHALGRAVLRLEDRPDAVAELLDRAARGEQRLGSFVPVLLALQGAHGRSSLGSLRLRARVEATWGTADQEGMLRRSFALAARETDLQRR